MTARTWNEGDRVAIRDRVGQPWALGTIKRIRPAGHLVIDLDWDSRTTTLRPGDDPRVIPVDDVPVDDRYWLTADQRDQLLREDAAGRLRGYAEELTCDALARTYFIEYADDLVEPIIEPPAAATRAARRLVNPAPQPTRVP